METKELNKVLKSIEKRTLENVANCNKGRVQIVRNVKIFKDYIKGAKEKQLAIKYNISIWGIERAIGQIESRISGYYNRKLYAKNISKRINREQVHLFFEKVRLERKGA